MSRRYDNRSWGGRLLPWALLAILMRHGLSPGSVRAAEQDFGGADAPRGFVVPLKVTPLADISERARSSTFARGDSVFLQSQKSPGCKYPESVSEAAFYGKANFQDAVNRAGQRCTDFHVALDCSQKGGDHDLLYFDENGNADLSDDRPKRILKDPPAGLAGSSSSYKETCFEPVTVPFDDGSGTPRSLQLYPRVRTRAGQTPQLALLCDSVFTGEFEIDGASYQAILGYEGEICGRLDRPATALLLVPAGSQPVYWWGGDRLNSTHRLGDRYYRFSCTPAGDKLFVKPYEGPLGVLEAGAGGRNVQKLQMYGSLRAKDIAVAVGDGLNNGWPKPTRRCELPTGDYYPAFMTIEMDGVRIIVSNNYHTNAQGQPRGSREVVAGIKIREDKPYVLDFSNKPAVVFEEPKENARLRLGAELKVEAALVDPVLDIMIRGLNDATVMVKESYKTPDGQERTFERSKSLDPKVFVQRADGEVVAEGVMPFG